MTAQAANKLLADGWVMVARSDGKYYLSPDGYLPDKRTVTRQVFTKLLREDRLRLSTQQSLPDALRYVAAQREEPPITLTWTWDSGRSTGVVFVGKFQYRIEGDAVTGWRFKIIGVAGGETYVSPDDAMEAALQCGFQVTTEAYQVLLSHYKITPSLYQVPEEV